ncbi:MAG TPA: C-terminal helicase domain-containing protein, partial [Afipia sp.]
REPHEKREVLRQLLRDAKDLKNAIIFCNRKREVALLYKSLEKHGFSVGALHGDMDQSARTTSLEQFRKGELPLLVASDVAARGLDIPEVSHVFNFDVPHHADDYVHRIGRTGRAGRLGTAISIVTPADQKSILAIEKLIGQPIPRAEGSFVTTPRGPAELSDNASEHDQPRREGRRSRGGRNKPSAAPSKPQQSKPQHVKPQPVAAVQLPPSIGRSAPAAAYHETHNEPADHSHLPAFLLRPVRARG